MPKKNGQWWNGGWQRWRKSEWNREKESSIRKDDLGSVTLIEKKTGFWIDGEPGESVADALPSTSKAEKHKHSASLEARAGIKKSKIDAPNDLKNEKLLNNQFTQAMSSTKYSELHDFDFDNIDLSFFDDPEVSCVDTCKDDNVNTPVIEWLQEKNHTHDSYKLPTVSYTQNDNADKVFAYLAFDMVRNRFSALKIKSSNKRTPSDSESVERVKLAKNVVFEVQKKTLPQYSTKNVHDFTFSMEKGAGNCGEMSGVVAQIINRSGGYATQYRVDDLSTHAFALSGRPPDKAVDHVRMSDYQGCWVIDPWAGIVCEAPNYCDEFKSKMSKWALKGKEVFTNGGWIPADSPLWINAVINGEKKVNIPKNRFSI